MERGRFLKDVSAAILAQLFTMVVSLVMTLVVSKILGVEQFAYWQLFIFYNNYVSICHLGLTDGIYLRFGGYEYNQLDFPCLGSQFWLMVGAHIVLGTAIVVGVLNSNLDIYRQIVWCLLAVSNLVSNAYWYFGEIFQAVNKTKIYSWSIILNKILFLVPAFVLVFIDEQSFIPFVVLFVGSLCVATAYIFYKGRRLFTREHPPLHMILHEAKLNIEVGLPLTLSNITNMFVLGIGQVFVEMTDGIDAFGYITLALSMTSFFLQFVTQVSMVLFPALRTLEAEETRRVYRALRRGVSLTLCVVMVLYGPARIFLLWWLPQYDASFFYLGILLPLCVFNGKMQLLYSTYMKVLRKERMLLIVNLSSLGLSVVLCGIAIFLYHDMILLALFMTIVVAFRSIIASLYLSKIYKLAIERSLFWEMGISSLFICSNLVLTPLWAFCLTTAAVGLYWALNWHAISSLPKLITHA